MTDESPAWKCPCEYTDLERCNGVGKFIKRVRNVLCNMTLVLLSGPFVKLFNCGKSLQIFTVVISDQMVVIIEDISLLS